MSASGYVHIQVRRIRQETQKAFQVVLEDGSMHWLPFSQIADAEDYSGGDENVEMSITRWIAEEKGIDAEEDE